MCTKVLGTVLKIKLALTIATTTIGYYGIIYIRSSDYEHKRMSRTSVFGNK